MARAFPERSDCPDVPTVDEIEGSLTNASQDVDTAPRPLCEFPFFDFPPGDPPLSDFGCFAIEMSTTLTESSDAALEGLVTYPNSSETGKCEPVIAINFSVPPCPGFTFSTSSVGIDDNISDPTLTFNISRKTDGSPCAFDVEFNLQLPPLGSTCEARAGTTEDITLSGLQTVDGVALATGELVLVKDQAIPANNGVYKAVGGAWTRTCTLKGGTLVSVREGTSNGGTIWMLTTNNPITLGVTDLDFELAGGAQCCCFARLATTGNIALTAAQSIDGVAAVVGDTVLVKDQTVASENGPYIVQSAAWTRTCDIVAGLAVTVREGDCNSRTNWFLTTNDPIDVDTTDLVFEIQRAPGNATVRVASNSNLAVLVGTFSIDGVVVAVGDRVLLTEQTDKSENGVYLVGAGAWVRDNQGSQIVEGMLVSVREGDAFSSTLWTLTTGKPIVLDTTDLSFAQVASNLALVNARAATTTGIVISGTPIIDGVSVIVGDSVLVKNQILTSLNGLYTVAAGSWDKDFSFTLTTKGSLIIVQEGSTQGLTAFLVSGVDTVAGLGAYVKDV